MNYAQDTKNLRHGAVADPALRFSRGRVAETDEPAAVAA
jgi:hypothetical protein